MPQRVILSSEDEESEVATQETSHVELIAKKEESATKEKR